MSNLRQVPVYILGLGQVGRQVVRDLSSAAAFHRQKYKVEFQIRGMFDTSGSVWDQISDEIIQVVL
jgi:homoserine dehydrogenase